MPTANPTLLNQFMRFEPIHGSNPGWFGNLFTKRKYWGIDARLTYSSGHNGFALNEAASGLAFGAAARPPWAKYLFSNSAAGIGALK